MKKKLYTLFCLFLFIGVVGIFFYPTFIQGKLPVPSDSLVGLYHPWRDLYAKEYPRGIPFKNFLITDPIRQQIPWRKIAIDQWKEGKIPIWNPYAFSGTPLAANVQAAVFYPLNIVFFLLEFSVAWATLIILQPLLGGMFLFFYLRHLKLDPLASLLGAVTWSFSGFSVAWLTWGTMMHVAIWLPLVLLSVDKLTQSQRFDQGLLWLLMLVLGLVLQVFAGHMQIALYCIGVAVGYAIYRIWQAKSNRLQRALWILLGIGAFITISSVQWAPMIKVVFESGRVGDVSNWMQDGWFIPWQHLIQFVAPDFFGNPTTLNYWGVWNYGELIGYVGMVPLIFVLFALFRNSSKDGVFWGMVTLSALLFALPTPFARFVYQMHLPILSALQPTRLMVIIDFGLVMLAALGFDAWLHKKSGNTWKVLLFATIVFLGLWAYVFGGSGDFQVSKRNLVLPSIIFINTSTVILLSFLVKKYAAIRLAGILLIGITVFDLLRFGWKFTPFTPREYFFPQTEVISYLQKQEKPFRIASIDNRIMPPNVSAYYGIETIEGYDPLIRAQYEELMASIVRDSPDITVPFGFNRIITLETIDSALLPLFNMRYVLSLADIERPFLKKVLQEGETRVYEYAQGLPRAYMVDELRVVATNQEAITMLFDKTFDPARMAVILKDPRNVERIGPLTGGTAKILSYAPDQMIIETQSEGGSFLVVAQSYTAQTYQYDWHVTVDKGIRSIYRTNYNFMGVLVPKGIHTVEFSL